ncbi:MAG: discoidin domain-containing protein, partial [Bacteroidota bacterium]
PAEADVSTRPGWYYHEDQDDKVKSLQQLLDIYYLSVGQNANLLLNFPVGRRGLIHENDVAQVMKLKEQLELDFATNLAFQKSVTATQVRGGAEAYQASNVTDDDSQTHWAADDGITEASLTIDFGEPTSFNRVLIQESIAFGQRVKQFSVEAEVNGEWMYLSRNATIGYKRILRLPRTEASRIRINIEDAKACPLISNVEVFDAAEVKE